MKGQQGKDLTVGELVQSYIGDPHAEVPKIIEGLTPIGRVRIGIVSEEQFIFYDKSAGYVPLLEDELRDKTSEIEGYRETIKALENKDVVDIVKYNLMKESYDLSEEKSDMLKDKYSECDKVLKVNKVVIDGLERQVKRLKLEKWLLTPVGALLIGGTTYLIITR